MITAVCQFCGEEFSTWPCKVNDGRAKYCSRKCVHAALSGGVEAVSCCYCGAAFSVPSGDAARGKGKYCSRQCMALGRAKEGRAKQDGLSSLVCCHCGRECPISEFRLKTNGKRSGRCRACRSEASRENLRLPQSRWTVGRSIAKRRGIPWDISLEDYLPLISRPCHYCGGPLAPTGGGLDRMDNEGTYSIDNVVPCCRGCNTVKGERFTYDEMLLLAPALQRIHQERQPEKSAAISSVPRIS